MEERATQGPDSEHQKPRVWLWTGSGTKWGIFYLGGLGFGKIGLPFLIICSSAFVATRNTHREVYNTLHGIMKVTCSSLTLNAVTWSAARELEVLRFRVYLLSPLSDLVQQAWLTDNLSSVLVPQLKMAFTGILSEADITAALAACQGKPHHETEYYNLGSLGASCTRCLAAEMSCQNRITWPDSSSSQKMPLVSFTHLCMPSTKLVSLSAWV